MLCCRPKKDKYNLEEAESNESDKKTKSKDSKKSKNQEELSERDMGNSQGKKKKQAENAASDSKKDENNVESEGKPNNVIASAEVESNKDQTVESHNDELGDDKKKDENKTVSGDTEMKLVEETVTKTNVGKEECAIGGVGESNLDKAVDKDKARTEFFREVYMPKEKVKEQTKSEASTDQDHKGSKSATDTDSTAKPERKSARADTEQPVAGDPEHTANTEKQPVAGVDPEQLASEDPDQVMSAAEMQAAITRLEAVAVRLESLAHTTGTTTTGGGGGGAAAPDVLSPSVLAYDDLTKGKFAEYLDLSSKIGGDVQAQAEMVKAGFQAVKDFLIIASKSKKPSQNDLVELLKPISNQITAVQDFRETKRGGKMFNHLSGISESLPALGWVSVEPTPGPYVKEMADAGMFFTNRVVKEFKETEPIHVDWTKAWLGTLRELQAYIKEHHTTGVTWNPQGGDAKSASVAKPPPPPSSGGPPPPPPPGPPPPPPPAMDLGEPSDGAPDARAALFADLNKGEGVTAGLKKVTDDMKTHKNPALRGSSQVSGVRAGPAPFKAPSGPKTAPKPNKVAAPAAAKPPVLELQQKKWVVEYQIGNKTMVIDQTNIKQTVYMYKCENSTLQIKGKVNSITLDTCKKVAIAFDDVVSSIEFVNCQSIQAQVIGKCPTVSIDKTDGCLMYLSKDSLDAEIVTAKSSEMNLLVPKDDGDFEEFPLPEQYKTKWNGKKFITGVADSI